MVSVCFGPRDTSLPIRIMTLVFRKHLYGVCTLNSRCRLSIGASNDLRLSTQLCVFNLSAKKSLGYPLPQAGNGIPPGWDWGIPPAQDRAEERVLATRRAVCLLWSRRRTFLLYFCTQIMSIYFMFL